MSIHAVKRSQSHLAWDNSIAPVLRVKSGDTVTFDCLDASNGQITPESSVAAISALVFSQLDQVNGPVYVEGAVPGDVLQVDVLSVKPAGWGWTACIPGFGLLADEDGFGGPALKIWKLDTEAMETYFYDDAEEGKRRIRIPLRPFAGEMGVAPGRMGAFSTIPPYATGGNIDTKHLSEGATLFLPVEVEGALFSIGDGHAAQGDGGTAIETPMTVSVRLTVRKDRGASGYTTTPHFRTPPKTKMNINNGGEEEGYYCTTGIDSDMREATRAAVRNMVAFLGAEHGMGRVEAYMLCSVVGDLRLHEVVDMPNYVVGMMIPRVILGGPDASDLAKEA
ncbi:Formamidase [Mycena filopes]|nr:Formamidase [Mycena filopes]